ncbi:sugar ABC transporter ATP-binding protein [Pseudogemmobacter hezensis]|uniref:sugar ABC transporter ATP-binding protein n=1 Tax=Pseudogemmobacter hezensis TaxID=2737662 RepID=UPI001C12E654|nr:sugar ABC transporter ATP-binding protein [Pseudogemmobacter hezensis]
MPASTDTPALDLRGIVRTYGPVRALDHAALSVRRGEVHGLIGQNGAGKSTLMKILAGIEQADQGEILLDGQPIRAESPAAMIQRGLGVIFQDRMLVGNFTVEEALFYATPAIRRHGPLLRRAKLRQEAERVIRRYFDTSLPPKALIRDLSTAEQQIVHITRTLLTGPSVIVLDEPTVALASREVENLFRAIREMRADGITVVYISHYLREITEICDRVTVLRNGRHVATVQADQTTTTRLTSLMTGAEIGSLFPPHNSADTLSGDRPIRFAAQGLGHRAAFADVSFDLREGEILGVTGLIGSGFKELARVIFGLDRATSGTMALAGRGYSPRSPREALAARVALVPEDRRSAGVGLALSLRENVTLASLRRFSPRGLMRRGAERQSARAFIERLAIKAPHEEIHVSGLSGGNQQKVAIAKWLCRGAGLYLLDEPSIGIDVAGKAEIYRLLRSLAAEGNAVIVFSSDLDEIQGLADRVLVFHRGRIALDASTADTSSGQLLAAAIAGSPHQAPDKGQSERQAANG